MTTSNILNLTQSQEQAVFRFAGKQVIASAMKRKAEPIAEALDKDLAQKMLLGAFVSLKRNGQLRSCMGCMAHELMPLGMAVETAAVRSATDDPRFPPISPSELESLEMEVWLLWGMRKLEEQGRDRLNAVEIGKHGLQIRYSEQTTHPQGARRGLLLPGVAVDHRLNAIEFLEAVCKKANLPKDAWLDDRSELCVFEGMAISGSLASLLQERIKPSFFPATNGPTQRDIVGLRDAARDNFFHNFDGGTPNYYQPQYFDGSMAGIALTVTLPDAAPLTCARNGIKADIPLQSTLTGFSAVLAEQIRRIGSDAIDLLQTRFDLFVQWDVAIHGSLDAYDLSGLDTKRRSLMLSVTGRWAIAYDVTKTPDQLLDDLLEKLDLDGDTKESNCIYSFETQSTSPNFAIESVPREPIYPQLRPAMLPGAFYPKLAKDIEAELTRMFAPGEIVPSTHELQPLPTAAFDQAIPVAAALVPHAGWVYSGRLAAQTLARAEIPETVVIFAPRHRAGGANWAIAPYAAWGIPYGNVAADLEWATRFVHAVQNFQFDETPHKHEHAIEVQLPLIVKLNPAARVVGVTMVGGDWDEIEEAAAKFATFLKQSESKPLLVISTDMNHFATEETTRHVDQMALDAIRSLVPEQFFDIVMAKQISMCGVYAAAFVLKTLQALGDLNEVLPIGYTTSGAVSGDLQRVVGYAGMLFR